MGQGHAASSHEQSLSKNVLNTAFLALRKLDDRGRQVASRWGSELLPSLYSTAVGNTARAGCQAVRVWLLAL